MALLRLSAGSLSPLGPTTILTDGTPVRRFKRYALEVGQRYVKRGWDKPLDITEGAAAHYLSTWQAMNAAGVPVKITADHKDSTKAENCMGDVVDVRREGNWITPILEVRGAKNIATAEANKDISVEILPRYTDGKGNTYQNLISAVTFTPIPVVTSQPIAASMADDDDTYFLSMETEMKPVFDKIAQLVGVNPSDVTEANALTHLDAHIAKCATMKLSLDEATAKVQTLSAAPVVDKKYLSLSAKFDEQELNHAVETGTLTPACRDELKALFVGNRESGEFSTIKLSMGEESTTLLEKVISIIKKNKPLVTGENLPAQHLSLLSRETPDKDKDGNQAPKVNPWTKEPLQAVA